MNISYGSECLLCQYNSKKSERFFMSICIAMFQQKNFIYQPVTERVFKQVTHKWVSVLGPLLLTWFNINPSMDK